MKPIKVARLFVIGIGILLSAGLSWLIVTKGLRGDWWSAVVLLGVIFGLSAALIWLGVFGSDKLVAEIVAEVVEGKPEEFLEDVPTEVESEQKSWSVTLLEVAVYLLVYAAVYGLALIGMVLLIEEGEMLWGGAAYLGALAIVLVYRRFRG